MLTKMVDGKKVVLTDDEEAAVLSEWADNDEKAKTEKPKSLEERIAALESMLNVGKP